MPPTRLENFSTRKGQTGTGILRFWRQTNQIPFVQRGLRATGVIYRFPGGYFLFFGSKKIGTQKHAWGLSASAAGSGTL